MLVRSWPVWELRQDYLLFYPKYKGCCRRLGLVREFLPCQGSQVQEMVELRNNSQFFLNGVKFMEFSLVALANFQQEAFIMVVYLNKLLQLFVKNLDRFRR